MIRLTIQEAEAAAIAALTNAGAAPAHAISVARACVDAETEGISGHGLRHLTYYLDGLQQGRIDGKVAAAISNPAPTIIASDAQTGFAHPAFDTSFEKLIDITRSYGTGMFCQHNAFTCGALGTFVRRIAEHGMMALAGTNGGPAIVAAPNTTAPTYCTNPIAFSVPRKNSSPLVIDQSSSQMAMSTIRDQVASGEPIPEGIALDEGGNPTTDPKKALKGMLLVFGGTRGANIALMVEMLSAGLSGSNWSIDAASYASGATSPASGLTILTINPTALTPDLDERVDAYLTRMKNDFGLYVPGAARAVARARAQEHGIELTPDIAELLNL